MSLSRCEAGCPSAGVLAEIKKHTKSRYKYAIRRVKRRRETIIREKIGASLSTNNSGDFWYQIKRLKHTKLGQSHSNSTVIDGFTSDSDISNCFASKLGSVLNSCAAEDRDSILVDIKSSLTSQDLADIEITPSMVADAMSCLKRFKSDGTPVSSNHLLYAAPALTNFLWSFFTAILRHGYMPKALADCILVPSLKSNKDPTSSDNYRPIALAPNLSKILEWCILQRYGNFLSTSDLQFGFKPGFSSDLCSGMLKNVVSRYINRGSKVFACFLDASKAFDRVNHAILFQLMIDRKLPTAVITFLLLWYSTQELTVRWNARTTSFFRFSAAPWSNSHILVV